MKILIFGLDGILRRDDVTVVAGVVNQVSETEGYLVEDRTHALEIRRPLFGFNVLGLFPPTKDLTLTAAANDGTPLLLSAGAEAHYRRHPLPTETEEGNRLSVVNVLAGQIAEHESARGVKEGRWDTLLARGIYTMMAVFVILIGVLLAPKLMETWSNYFGN